MDIKDIIRYEAAAVSGTFSASDAADAIMDLCQFIRKNEKLKSKDIKACDRCGDEFTPELCNPCVTQVRDSMKQNKWEPRFQCIGTSEKNEVLKRYIVK
tara:strand:- start:383 stop:679 length:297 start_codon:yes stop_codon:yes gene_type:complete